MGESQLYPHLVIGGAQTLIDGTEVEAQDVALVGQVAGLADDRVLAELLRLAEFNSVPSRAILPFTISNAIHYSPGTVVPHTGGVAVRAFRAIIGSRTSGSIDARAAWQDIRSGIFVGPNTVATVLLAANSSGNPRWDLVYATLNIDASANSRQRRVKDPDSSAVSVQSVYQTRDEVVTISVAQGTPGSSPVPPTLPADVPPAYNIPLALVRVANGFPSSPTAPAAGDIRDVAPATPLAESSGARTLRPAAGNNDRDGTLYGNIPYTGTSGQRPGMYLPPTMVGSQSLVVAMQAVSSLVSHPDGSVIDDTVDWTNRYFRSWVHAGGSSTRFGQDNTASSVLTLPANVGVTGGIGEQWQSGNSFQFSPDATFGAGLSTIVQANSGASPWSGVLAGSTEMGIYCDASGVLRAHIVGDPTARMVVWIEATGQFPNP